MRDQPVTQLDEFGGVSAECLCLTAALATLREPHRRHHRVAWSIAEANRRKSPSDRSLDSARATAQHSCLLLWRLRYDPRSWRHLQNGHRAAADAGRDPSTLGMDGRAAWRGDRDQIAETISKWASAGGLTHIGQHHGRRAAHRRRPPAQLEGVAADISSLNR